MNEAVRDLLILKLRVLRECEELELCGVPRREIWARACRNLGLDKDDPRLKANGK